MESRQEPLHGDVDELHQRGDDEDERERVDVAETVGREQPAVDAPRHSRGNGHHEHDGAGHTKRGLRLLRDAKERTAPEKAAQDEVIDEDGPDENHQVIAHFDTSLPFPQSVQ